MNRSKIKRTLAAAALSALAIISGCQRQQAAAPPPVPEVSVMTVEPQQVVLTMELPGRTASFRISEVRPQVSGLILKRLFEEGTDVKAGQVLYQIDPASFQAAYDSAAANLLATQKAAEQAKFVLNASLANVKRQEATRALAKINRDRFEQMFKERVATENERDQAVTNMDVAEATLKAAEAQVESDRGALASAEAAIQQAQASLQTAKINLGYAQITAPISGRIGRSHVTEGAMVTAYQVLPLATIQSLDPIYVDVPQSTAELMRLRKNLKNGRLHRDGAESARVQLLLEDGTTYGQAGKLRFRDVTVDPTTGSVILRIEVPNPDLDLLPGMFVRAVIEEGVDPQAILVPQQAITRDPRGNPLALVLDPEGKVQQRRLTTDRAIGDKWLVLSGLEKGDRVLVEGVQKVRPGMSVKVAEPAPAAPAQTASARESN